MKNTYKNIFKSGYMSENLIDVVISLLVLKFFGFQIAVVVILALIMADVATIMKKLYRKSDSLPE